MTRDRKWPIKTTDRTLSCDYKVFEMWPDVDRELPIAGAQLPNNGAKLPKFGSEDPNTGSALTQIFIFIPLKERDR